MSIVLRPDDLPVVERGGGARTVHLIGPSVGSRSFMNGITRLDPGAQIPLHFHNCEESVMVLEGQATFEDEQGTRELEAGDITLVPAGVVHRFANRGEGPMSILWIYGSVAATRTDAVTGETRPVLQDGRRAGR